MLNVVKMDGYMVGRQTGKPRFSDRRRGYIGHGVRIESGQEKHVCFRTYALKEGDGLFLVTYVHSCPTQIPK